MSSILTNTGAMVALQTLKGINSNLSKTQSDISTGKSIGSAKDNAAIWSISKTMESDVKGFNAISDSLALGQSSVAVARKASETVTDLLTQMKDKIVAAQQENVDRDKLQTDVSALREQINSVVSAAQFNGLNLVDGSSAADVDILSSLNRDSSGNVTSGTIAVERQNLSTTGGTFVAASMGTDQAGTAIGGAGDQNVANAYMQAGGDDTNLDPATDYDPDDPLTATSTIAEGGTLDFTFSNVAEGVSYSIMIDDMEINTADGGATTGARTFTYVATAEDSVNDVAKALGDQIQAFFDAATDSGEGYSVTFDPAGSGADNVFRITNAAGGSAADLLVFAEVTEGGTPESGSSTGLAALATLDVSTSSGATSALSAIDDLIQTATDAAAAFGSVETRIETQSDFVSNLTSAMKEGIGSLVDADMEEASARLQALQTQQQLGIQALSIANQQPQNILSLFK